jgi:hypothetical protein
VKQLPSSWTISRGSVHEFKHLKLSAEAFKLFGHLMHSVLSMLNTENSSQVGTPLTLMAGLGLTIQFSLFGSGIEPGGHHSHCGQSKSLLKIWSGSQLRLTQLLLSSDGLVPAGQSTHPNPDWSNLWLHVQAVVMYLKHLLLKLSGVDPFWHSLQA